MSRFIQLHLLTFYPPSNVNRDDTGRPKTAIIGGAERLRVSSQALKRAIRTSESFRAAMQGHLGNRTQRLGEAIEASLIAEGQTPEAALAAAREVARFFGKLKGEKDSAPARIEQLAFVSPTEREAALALARRVAAGDKLDEKKDTPLLAADTAVDIAMFGRMLADAPEFNREAAVQVAHAFTTHKSVVESDYYTAMDDEKPDTEDVGAGFIGQTGFGSGVFYLYICVNTQLLTHNLAGDGDLAARAMRAFCLAAAQATPSGKINSFANHSRPDFVLAEIGDAQPRSLAGAFLQPVPADAEAGLMQASILRLQDYRARMDAAYGPFAADAATLNIHEAGQKNLAAIADFTAAAVAHD